MRFVAFLCSFMDDRHSYTRAAQYAAAERRMHLTATTLSRRPTTGTGLRPYFFGFAALRDQ